MVCRQKNTPILTTRARAKAGYFMDEHPDSIDDALDLHQFLPNNLFY